ncbi:hypothetical protein BDF14DRAFT_1824590 [Spinellus fusiger]|nr:hypothetical protein BDF14DRAFT_1824590 [Spinellus fusiger]
MLMYDYYDEPHYDEYEPDYDPRWYSPMYHEEEGQDHRPDAYAIYNDAYLEQEEQHNYYDAPRYRPMAPTSPRTSSRSSSRQQGHLPMQSKSATRPRTLRHSRSNQSSSALYDNRIPYEPLSLYHQRNRSDAEELALHPAYASPLMYAHSAQKRQGLRKTPSHGRNGY